MAISTVQANINGQNYNLTYNGTSEKWEATITSPSITSYNENAEHYYAVSITATNDASTSTTVDDTDITLGNSLKLYVKEKVKPTVVINSPSSGAKVTVGKPTIAFTLHDEANGSGINIESLILTIDGGANIGNADLGMTTTPVTNGYDCTYVCQTTLLDGSHTINVTISDNDGNTETTSCTFSNDTVVPSLNVENPANELITNNPNLTVNGTVSDATSNPITVTITNNAVDVGAVTVTAGEFSKPIVLSEGLNTIVITAIDNSGLESSVTRTVTLNTDSPVISSVTLVPNPVDAGQTFILSVTVTG